MNGLSGVGNNREDTLIVFFTIYTIYIWKPDVIPASRQFSDKSHNFNTHAKSILIEQMRHIDIDKEKNKERLKQRENFRIITLETLTPKGLNQKLN